MDDFGVDPVCGFCGTSHPSRQMCQEESDYILGRASAPPDATPDPMSRPCLKCNKIHPFASACDPTPEYKFEQDIKALIDLSLGGKGERADQQANFRRGISGQPEVSSNFRWAHTLGARIREALVYLYEVELDCEEAHSAVPTRSLFPDVDRTGSDSGSTNNSLDHSYPTPGFKSFPNAATAAGPA